MFFTELIELEKTLEMKSYIWEKLFSEKTHKNDGKFLLPREWMRLLKKKNKNKKKTKKNRSQPIFLYCF